MKTGNFKRGIFLFLCIFQIAGCADVSTAEDNFSNVSPGESEEASAKQIIELGCEYAGEELKETIHKFNSENDTYHVECKEYGYDEDIIRRVLIDFVTGKGPDLISLGMIEEEEYVEKNLLEDLSSYLDRDNGVQRDELVESVLKCNTVNGKLICIPPQFSINTLMGKASELGDDPGWTVEEFMEYVRAHEGAEIFEGVTRGQSKQFIVLYNVGAEPDKYVNWQEGTVSFDTPEFLEMLEFAGSYESKYYDEHKSTGEKIRDGDVLLYNQNIRDMESFLLAKEMFEGDINFIGYPSKAGAPWFGIHNYDDFAMGAFSECKEGAWSFLEYLIKSQNMDNPPETSSFPVLKSALNDRFQKSMEVTYYLDENMQERMKPLAELGDGGKTYKIYPASQEDVNQVQALIDGVSYVFRYGTVAESIIWEEMEAYFAGQKTAQEAVDMIQNRMQIYVNEQK